MLAPTLTALIEGKSCSWLQKSGLWSACKSLPEDGAEKPGGPLQHQSGYKQRGQGPAPKKPSCTRARQGEAADPSSSPTVNRSSPKRLGPERVGEGGSSCNQDIDTNLLSGLWGGCGREHQDKYAIQRRSLKPLPNPGHNAKPGLALVDGSTEGH